MHLPKRILVATDFSEPSEAALDYAIDLAKQLGANIVLVHAYELPTYGFTDAPMLATTEMAVNIMTGAQAGVAAMCERHEGCGVEIGRVVRQGNVYEEVQRVADEVDADLIVVGTHGRKGVARVFLGSVAEKIIRTATRPVLTVHEKINAVKRGSEQAQSA